MKLLSILFIAVIGLAASEAFTRDRRQVQNFQPFGNQFPFQQLPFPQIPVGGAGQGQGSFVSTSQTLNSRFGDDEPVVSGQTTVIRHKDGKYEQTNYHHRPDGSTGQTHSSGRVKRQQTQSQLQDGGNGGNQQQTQSQNQPGAQQFQTQSQGPNATPAAGQQLNQNSIPQGNTQFEDRNQQGNDQYAQGGQGGQQYPQGGGQQYPQGNQGGQQYPQGNQGGQQYPQGNQQFGGQPGFGFAPFGFGSFGPGGFGAAPFPQAGFAPGFAGFPFQQQPGFGFPAGNIPPGAGAGQGPQSGFTGSRIDSRFSDDDSGSVSGGTQTFSSNNGVFHSETSVLGPDGKVHTHRTSGRHQ